MNIRIHNYYAGGVPSLGVQFSPIYQLAKKRGGVTKLISESGVSPLA